MYVMIVPVDTHMEGATQVQSPPSLRLTFSVIFFFFRVSKLETLDSLLHASALLLLNCSCSKCHLHSSSEEILTTVARVLIHDMSSLSGIRNLPRRNDLCCPRRGKAHPSGLTVSLSLNSGLLRFLL